MSRLDDPGIGLRDNGRRVLRYADLKSVFDDPDGREPGRTIELHLTGHMERFAWSFNGVKFSDAEPLRLTYGERLRIVLVNDTMMTHPIHLHGMWSDIEDDEGKFHLRKHTVDMPPGHETVVPCHRRCLGAVGVSLPPALSHGSRHVPGSAGGRMTRRRHFRRAVVIAGLLLATSAPAFAQADSHAGHQDQPKPNPPATEPAQKPPELPPFIPPVTDEARKAAFPDVEGHAVHGRALDYFVLFDQLEWRAAEAANGVSIDSRGWIGRDRDRLWFRAEGDGEGEDVDEAQTHVLYGRQFARYWDLVGGIRQDFSPGPAQTWAAFGVQGLAPYWFDIEATGYVGASGRTHARFEVEYELLFTNRLVLQPLFEAELFGKSDPERGVGAGLSTTDLGFRLRYEIRREFAPYLGITWSNKWGKTADFAAAAGEDTGGARFVTGLRLWF